MCGARWQVEQTVASSREKQDGRRRCVGEEHDCSQTSRRQQGVQSTDQETLTMNLRQNGAPEQPKHAVRARPPALLQSSLVKIGEEERRPDSIGPRGAATCSRSSVLRQSTPLFTPTAKNKTRPSSRRFDAPRSAGCSNGAVMVLTRKNA